MHEVPDLRGDDGVQLVDREEVMVMAKNTGQGHRIGSVKDRSQTQTPAGNWVERDTNTGRFINQKEDKKPFKGVTKEPDDR